jgi:hypothetical protein
MRPGCPGTIPSASVVSQPQVNVRTRTTMAAPYVRGMTMRVVLAAVLLLVGVVWILQGLDVLGGYGMSGHIEWTVIGAILVVVAVGLLVGARRLDDD